MSETIPTDPASMGLSRQSFEQLLDVARQLASSTNLEEVLNRIIDALRDVLGAERASVFQYDADTEELFATQAHGLPRALRLPVSQGLVGEAARGREIISVDDAYADPRFNQAVDKETGFRTRCLLTIPMVDFEGELVGVAQVLNKRDGQAFDDDDRAIAQHLADQAGAALKRAALLEARAVKHKLEADLLIARRMQQAALPTTLPEAPGYDLSTSFSPAEHTGGDAFDVIALQEDASRLLIFMGDATGHGVGPALSAAQAVSMVRMGARLGATIEDIANQINEQLVDDLPVGRFVTAFFGELDALRHTLHFVSAGQAPLLVVRASGKVDSLSATGLPLGVDDVFAVDEPQTIVLEKGDVFALLSDGFYEALSPQEDEFGVQGVAQAIQSVMNGSSQSMLDRTLERVEEHTQGAAPMDDRTAIILKRRD